jgi:hypothetical protein
VTTADILKVAGTVFKKEKMNLSVIGPFKKEGDFLPLMQI